jgi:hypothetical protein
MFRSGQPGRVLLPIVRPCDANPNIRRGCVNAETGRGSDATPVQAAGKPEDARQTFDTILLLAWEQREAFMPWCGLRAAVIPHHQRNETPVMSGAAGWYRHGS